MSTLTLRTDEYGRVRNYRSPDRAVSEMLGALAHLDDALHTVASYVDFARNREEQTYYDDMAGNNVPEHVLQALFNLGEATRGAESLALRFADQQADEEVEVTEEA